MRKFQFILIAILPLFLLSCVGEGEGGTSAVDGYVYTVLHLDREYSLDTDTFPAAEARVYIKYGGEEPYSDDMRAGADGYFKFKYLTKGEYTVFAYSEYQNGRMEAVMETVTVGRGETGSAKDIYVHQGKMYGKYQIKGQVKARYFKSGSMVHDYRPVVAERVYIRKKGIEQSFDDVRTGENGIFILEKIPAGTYEVYAVSENTDRTNEIDPAGIIEVTIEKDQEINTIELENPLLIRLRS